MKDRKWRRTIGTLLAAAMICASLAGCSKGGAAGTGKDSGTGGGDSQGNGTESAGEQAMGRFLEEELDTGVVFGNIYDMKKLDDGSLRIIGTNEDNGNSGVWDSADGGKTWQSVYDLPDEMQNSEKGWMDYAAISPGGQVF